MVVELAENERWDGLNWLPKISLFQCCSYVCEPQRLFK